MNKKETFKSADATLLRFTDRPSVMDIGLGVLYFFTSHMVIRTMYYVGFDRQAYEIIIFLLILVASIGCVHLFSKRALRLRSSVESLLGIPIVTIVAAAGAVLALISMLPVMAVGWFYASGVLLGVACGWVTVIWASTIKPDRLDSQSFYIHPSLMVAVLTYFLFRCIGATSEIITQGFFLALPLITIVCIIQSSQETDSIKVSELGENVRALQVLVVVAAAFALSGSVVVYITGHSSFMLSSGLNYMTLFEVLVIVLIVVCCYVMNSFSQQRATFSPRMTIVFMLCIVYLPLFLIGLVMGNAGVPTDSPNALWESSIWVLLIAIFAYDIRQSLYAVKGLAVGLMFEAMCIGQLIGYILTSSTFFVEQILAIFFGLLYFGAVVRQFFRSRLIKKKHDGLNGAQAGLKNSTPVLGKTDPVSQQRAESREEIGDENSKRKASNTTIRETFQATSEFPFELKTYCQKLALEYGLTPREAEVLEFIALGRSAKYIAEQLTVSLNTARTHVKHVYEKLSIHSKQELLDLVLYGSGAI